MTPTEWLLVALAIAALAALWAGSSLLSRSHRGRLVYVDVPGAASPLLEAPRYRLRGRPDEVRQDWTGRPVPIEWKTTRTPRGGPRRSHLVQLWAYCLLAEETSGVAPAVGVLRYGDGQEFDVPWNDRSRRELLAILREMRVPYDGRSTPTPGKCRRCRFAPVCDVRA